MKQTFDIDFVLPWVDGSDPKWVKSFNKHAPPQMQKSLDFSAERYRDYGLLKYWFRGVEKFAPYVRKIHFITNGQKPDWLNLESSKLNWVKHSDYIRAEYLPVFSANPIENGMRAIKDLADHFVYFNDDFFLTAPTTPDFFFKNGLPCDYAISNIQIPEYTVMRNIVMNDLAEINRCFDKGEYMRKNLLKYLNPKYGRMNIRTLACLLWKETTGFQNFHFPQPYLKSTLDEVWENCHEILESTMKSKFRSETDVNQWLFRYWQLCKGNFHPINPKKHRKYYELDENINEICTAIKKQKYKEIVLNDAECEDFDERMQKITEAFESILPKKSTFEV